MADFERDFGEGQEFSMGKVVSITGITGQDGSSLAELRLKKQSEVRAAVGRSWSADFKLIGHAVGQHDSTCKLVRRAGEYLVIAAKYPQLRDSGFALVASR
ncbi:hypothetical protein [Altericroceibacterium xinjiangense]|uniref:hypothetical protein n=1 Tax=Altericroceibacterium xinjiangense TaxID=762261 RepID=UPI0019D28D1F|nr:hypothetical protein [Altericroceibacterium xinjiangense]